MKKDIHSLCCAAEADLKLSDGAARLFLLVVHSHNASAEFPLSAREAASLCGLRDHGTIYSRIHELSPKYLTPLGVKGCPPTSWFKINK